jgi:trk system potassium uptake protein TrkA
MSKQFAVIGLGRFGFEVALWLSQHHFQTLAIDVNRNLVQEISKDVDNAMCFDSTNESALRDARIDEIDTVICAIGDHHVQNNILTTALLKQFGVPRIVARASTDLHARILKIVGANEVVNPEKEMGMRTAQKVATPGLTELIPLSDNAAIAELKVPESFIGKNIYDLRIRSRYGINVIGIRRLKENLADEIDIDDKQSRNFILSFSPEEIFEKDDVFVVAGKESDVKKFASIK